MKKIQTEIDVEAAVKAHQKLTLLYRAGYADAQAGYWPLQARYADYRAGYKAGQRGCSHFA